ncbi:MAG: PilZ domain-containing protein [Spirochaetes bacterium]|jgi:hypothetical protein|nr:PilZ domain-containing protein [Spirochaetota bacterium]
MSRSVKNSRQYQASTSEKKIADHISENSDNSDLFIKHKGVSYPVRLLGYSDRELSIESRVRIAARNIRFYWKNIYHCELGSELVNEQVAEDGVYNYTFLVQNLLIPRKQRRELRYKTSNDKCRLGKVTIPVVNESPQSILHSDNYQLCKNEMLKKLEFYDFFRVFPFESRGAPSEVVFSMISGTILYLKDISQYNSFVEKNSNFFDVHKSLRSHLLNRLKTLNLRYHSLLVRPFDYVTITGSQFTLAYFVVARSDTEITNEDILYLDQVSHDFFLSLQSTIHKTVRCRGRIENLSVTGARVFFEKGRVSESLKLSSELSIVFSVIGVADIVISGEVVYLERRKTGVVIGFAFRNSPFGSRLNKFLYEAIQKQELSIY